MLLYNITFSVLAYLLLSKVASLTQSILFQPNSYMYISVSQLVRNVNIAVFTDITVRWHGNVVGIVFVVIAVFADLTVFVGIAMFFGIAVFIGIAVSVGIAVFAGIAVFTRLQCLNVITSIGNHMDLVYLGINVHEEKKRYFDCYKNNIPELFEKMCDCLLII